jgi:hypothetical protein
MKPEIAKEWVKMLRSKKYKQGKSALKYKYRGVTRHCCLGVLCELYQKTHKKKMRVTQGVGSVDTPENAVDYDFAGEYAVLPKIVQKWAGMKSYDGEVCTDNDSFSLTLLNDDGSKFTAIANRIEKNVKNL